MIGNPVHAGIAVTHQESRDIQYIAKLTGKPEWEIIYSYFQQGLEKTKLELYKEGLWPPPS